MPRGWRRASIVGGETKDRRKTLRRKDSATRKSRLPISIRFLDAHAVVDSSGAGERNDDGDQGQDEEHRNEDQARAAHQNGCDEGHKVGIRFEEIVTFDNVGPDGEVGHPAAEAKNCENQENDGEDNHDYRSGARGPNGDG